MSSRLDGLSSTQTRFMPSDSSWNTPSVSPRPSMSYVRASSSGIVARSKSGFVVRLISSLAAFITVRLRRPRKSNLSRPMRSTMFMSYCVLTSLSPSLTSGTWSVSGFFEITTPAACVDACAREPFDRIRGVEQLAHLRAAVIEHREFGNLFERGLDRKPARTRRNQLRDPVDVGQRHGQRAARHRGPRRARPSFRT